MRGGCVILLNALAEVSNTTTASIKFYRREGLLPAGTRLTATRQDYDQGHVERLQLIRVLREEAGATIPDIRALVTLIDDPRRPLVDALEIAQALGELLEGMWAAGSPVDRGRRRPGTSSWPARCGEWSPTIG
ncbi:MerR family transcriptional regulator [Kocuria marina]|uniref:MerR family transcriptional regulator n=1 Tax=Kocuria marina TaxID=223184 RepID=UPI002989E7D1|nr:MerR family transcriptional regulator [Kocuria marina]